MLPRRGGTRASVTIYLLQERHSMDLKRTKELNNDGHYFETRSGMSVASLDAGDFDRIMQAINNEPKCQGLTAESVLRNIPRGLCTHPDDPAWLSCRFCLRNERRLMLPNEVGDRADTSSLETQPWSCHVEVLRFDGPSGIRSIRSRQPCSDEMGTEPQVHDGPKWYGAAWRGSVPKGCILRLLDHLLPGLLSFQT